ncbi:putative helicase [Sulfolobus islandicus filamentous virus]|uniref:Putative helicase 22 n=1 Tax=Sulfolobus islandicus filamentous virus (isolate Iceland/Hveragerdi) TaxID=654908 RepID=Y022_SIFVH|nr:putative helicase [Sulfolobus islandicus filamentous virus]Q914K8.1 RecName: Full=Putative helicase 22 [Sulfolobus islandicus filamentous virus (isolate Hveragerdi)]AAL27733.1 putative helicase [Sulfolobus islandicus filamentous virus]
MTQNINKIYLPSPNKYLSREDFLNYTNLMREIANFDPSTKKWYINEYKISRLTKDELKGIIDQIAEYIGNSIYNILSNYIKDDNNIINAYIKGNYIYIRDNLEKYKNLLTYKIKTFDYKEGKYTEEEILLAWQKSYGFVTLRGLYWKLKNIANFDLKPFTNLRFYDIQLKNFEMRNYQINSIKSWVSDVNVIGNGIIKAPTGSGKSVIAILSALEILKNKNNAKIVYAVNSTTLLKQFQNFAKKEDLPFVLVSGEIDEIKKGERSDFIALSISYYYSKKKRNEHEKLKELVTNADLVIIDEAHHTPANIVKSLLLDSPNSIRLGLSATPIREDGKELEIMGLLGKISFTIDYTELVRNRYLVPIEYIRYIPEIPKKLKLKIQDLDDNKDPENFAKYYSSLLRSFEHSPNTNKQIISKIKQLNQYPCLVIVRRIAIAKKLAEIMRENGIIADWVSSKTKLEERMEKIEALKNEKLQVLISTSLADEGLDIPNLRLVVLLTQGKSRIKLIQRIGRVMRVSQNKRKGYILDVIYNHDLFIKQSVKKMNFIENEYNGIITIHY